jgi:hypothetical protein
MERLVNVFPVGGRDLNASFSQDILEMTETARHGSTLLKSLHTASA